MQTLTTDELIELVQDWAKEHNINEAQNEILRPQLRKVQEEVDELKEAWLAYRFSEITGTRTTHDLVDDVVLELGDVVVTLVVLAQQAHIDLNTALQLAYEKIKNRTGETMNGTFVKSEDL